MLSGDPTDWIARFRSLDVRFLERLSAVWPRCKAKLPTNPDEDTITINLVDFLSHDAEIRRWVYYVEYQFEPFGYTEDGWAYSKGKIDLALLLDFDRETYLAYECKKLNVNEKGRFRTLATEYVTEGVLRFVSEKYAASLPIGCTLGYVMDGKLESARESIGTALFTNRVLIGLTDGITEAEPIGGIRRFISKHYRTAEAGEIELRHALLAF